MANVPETFLPVCGRGYFKPVRENRGGLQDYGRRELDYGITGSNAGNGKGEKEQLVQGERVVQLPGGAARGNLEKEKDLEPESAAPIQDAPTECGL